ncbi:MAG TPA: LLM class flavin-dependent oxidoreductase, partial [Candidatus Methylacidiphilales bacterium]|nr:LLM class flavin-dependent oxidoreductase [Candidatus Methylacidiphilales bacterium]
FGHHPAAWRHPESPGSGDPDFAYWVRLTQLAEQAKLHTVFLADFVGSFGADLDKLEHRSSAANFEPLTLMSALAAVTKRIGLIATVNTNFTEPYNVARAFSSLDHLSGGRAGWNVVSSLSEGAARSFGLPPDETLDHPSRYERAGEFVELAKSLWDSWDDNSFSFIHKESGAYLNRNTAHPVHHEGRYFTSHSLLDTARPVQGYPVLVQAGNSDTGKEFAARIAEMVYCSAQSLEIARAYYADVKSRLAKYGRHPDSLRITPGLGTIIGSSEAEAQDKFQQLQSRIDFSRGVNLFGYDLSRHDLDGPLPDNLPEPENGKGRARQLRDLARRENLTIRQLVLRFSITRGHLLVVGTAKQVADKIEEWYTSHAADGFNVVPPLLPGGFEDFVTHVVPELQRRGLFRREYQGSTLREDLGLVRPANPHTVAPAQAGGIAGEPESDRDVSSRAGSTVKADPRHEVLATA